MHRFANPTNFMRVANAIFPWAAGLAVILFALGLPVALYFSPPDYQQGETVRLFYIHVPSAWISLMAYSVIAAGSATFLIWRHPMANVTARAAAPIGALFTAVALITGMLWGQPMWGTFWVWDARLTSELILLFLYLGFMFLHAAIDDPRRADRAAAVIAIVGAINVPIIYFSVKWWNTLHQGASVSLTKSPTMASTMLWGMLIMSIAFWLYAIAAVLTRVRSVILERERNAEWVKQLETGA